MTNTTADSYPVIVHRKNGGVVVEIPALAIVTRAGDLEAAEREARRRAQTILDSYAESGLSAPEVVRDGKVTEVQKSEVKTFAVKTAIFWVGIFFVAAAGFYPVSMALRSLEVRINTMWETVLYQSTKAAEPRAISVALETLVKTLDSITEERKEELIFNLTRLADQMEPFAAPIRPLINGPQDGETPAGQ